MLYKPKKPQLINAIQFENSDLPRINNSGKCSFCMRPLNEHGIISNNLICPSHYIIKEKQTIINILTKDQFEATYVPVGEVVAEIPTAFS